MESNQSTEPEKGGRRLAGAELAKAVAGYADDKQAENICILDLRGISTLTDYFVICEGSSMPHLRAIRNEISTRLKDDCGEKASGSDGTTESNWMVIDYGDVIVHIFHHEKRTLYDLESLWSDAPRIEFEPVVPE